nr:MAG TPA: hypothetical protein [Caudoviricetes sp.]
MFNKNKGIFRGKSSPSINLACSRSSLVLIVLYHVNDCQRINV